jgi:AcrR family transcriptional regulator
MRTPARLIRAVTDSRPENCPPLTPRQQALHDRILAAGALAMARFGRPNITLGEFAVAIRLPPATIRRHFPDLDSLLGHIIRAHLRAILARFAEVPADAPDRPAALRAAYLAEARGEDGGYTAAHQLLLRDGLDLPPDEAAPTLALHASVKQILGDDPRFHALLDLPSLASARVEALLAAITQPVPHAAARPVAQPVARSVARSVAQSAGRAAPEPAPQFACQSPPDAASQPASQGPSQPEARPELRPDTQPATQPHAQPAPEPAPNPARAPALILQPSSRPPAAGPRAPADVAWRPRPIRPTPLRPPLIPLPPARAPRAAARASP